MTLIHGTCVAFADGDHWSAVLLQGRSGVGKSDLALRLIDVGASLVADDQVALAAVDGRVTASAPDRLAGLLEVRGLGIVKQPCLAVAEIVSQQSDRVSSCASKIRQANHTNYIFSFFLEPPGARSRRVDSEKKVQWKKLKYSPHWQIVFLKRNREDTKSSMPDGVICIRSKFACLDHGEIRVFRSKTNSKSKDSARKVSWLRIVKKSETSNPEHNPEASLDKPG